MNTEPNKCLGIFGWMFGHRFVARWDTEEKLAPSAESVIAAVAPNTNVGRVMDALSDRTNLEGVVEQLKETKTTYLCDVCVRCGALRQRVPGPAAGQP